MKILLSKNAQRIKSFEIRYKRMAMLFKKLSIICEEYLVDVNTALSGNMIGKFQWFFVEGICEKHASSRKIRDAVTLMGGDAVIGRVQDLLDEIENIEIHIDPSKKQAFIEENIYTYTTDPQAISLYKRLRSVDKGLKDMNLEASLIERVLNQYSWSPADRTIKNTNTFKRMLNKQAQKSNKPQLEELFC